MSRRILALDQSSRTSGYAIFVEGRLETFGHFTIKDEDIGIRLLKIRQQVETLVNKYNITEVIMEDIQLQTNISNNVSTFKALAEVFGVIYELLTEMNIKVTSALASSWKSKLKIKSRQRQQQKQEAQELVSTLYSVKATQDEADAICIGTYYLISENLPKEDAEENYDWSD